MKLKALSVITILSLILLNCKKEPEINEGSLIKRTVQTYYDRHTTVDTFLYDTQKRLTGIKYFNTNTKYDNKIEYDEQARLSKARYSYMGVEKYSCSFIYNEKGQIIKKLVTPSSPGLLNIYDESYAYDNTGRLISDTTYHTHSSSVQYYLTFKYDTNGNIVEDNFRNFIDSGNQGKTVYIFDKHPNPYNIHGNNYFYVTGNSLSLSKNNVMEWKPWWSNSIATKFEYQTNGLPKKFTITDPNGPYVSTFSFEYW